MEPSKKTQLLYKLFMKGYKNPNSMLGHDNSPQRSHSYSFGRKMNPVEESEQRYKKRQRRPDEGSLEPPSPTNASVEIVEVSSDSETRMTPEPTDKLLDLKWTCSTLDKRRDAIADYFQRSVLKQRFVYDDEQLHSGSSLYENYCIFLRNEIASPSPEPIYTEICGSYDLQPNISDSSEVKTQEFPNLPSSSNEHLYENLDIIRHEIFLKQQSMDYILEEDETTTNEDDSMYKRFFII
ncbi:unnamed protein product [Allacma fusca]|uniref:Uncharacterized protein n=1 Tax=Allacma fusca TaxID=39272 RepID=A0A8J2KD36_9HEXA|nr:unnamed protein product [Allacma fusca]